jgi:DNA-binding MarR family transcriptional regulator
MDADSIERLKTLTRIQLGNKPRPSSVRHVIRTTVCILRMEVTHDPAIPNVMCPHHYESAISMNKDMVPRPCVCTSIREAARVLARTYDAALAPSGMNVTQLAVIRAVLRHPGEPLTRVSEDLAMDRTSLYRAIEALKKQGWLTVRDAKDNRSCSASITRNGELALSQADPGWSKTQSDVVVRFGHTEWQAFVRELQRLIDCTSGMNAGELETGRRR